jgi:hypothetical protein
VRFCFHGEIAGVTRVSTNVIGTDVATRQSWYRCGVIRGSIVGKLQNNRRSNRWLVGCPRYTFTNITMGDTDWNGENPWKSNRGVDFARPMKVLAPALPGFWLVS